VSAISTTSQIFEGAYLVSPNHGSSGGGGSARFGSTFDALDFGSSDQAAPLDDSAAGGFSDDFVDDGAGPAAARRVPGPASRSVGSR